MVLLHTHDCIGTRRPSLYTVYAYSRLQVWFEFRALHTLISVWRLSVSCKRLKKSAFLSIEIHFECFSEVGKSAR